MIEFVLSRMTVLFCRLFRDESIADLRIELPIEVARMLMLQQLFTLSWTLVLPRLPTMMHVRRPLMCRSYDRRPLPILTKCFFND